MDGRSFLWRRPLFLIEKAIQRCKIAGSYVSSNTGACEYGDAVTTGVPRRFVSELAGLTSCPLMTQSGHEPPKPL